MRFTTADAELAIILIVPLLAWAWAAFCGAMKRQADTAARLERLCAGGILRRVA